MTIAHETERSTSVLPRGRRIPKGLITMAVALVVLLIASWILAPSSVGLGTTSSMLTFGAVLAVVGLGQMLVVQQGGVDLSIPGAVSLAIVIVSHEPDGDNSRVPAAIVLALAFAIGAGVLNGFMVGFLKLNAIIATLGTNALLFGAVLGISGGTPRTTPEILRVVGGGTSLGLPNALIFALILLVIVSFTTKKTIPGRRFEAIGANPNAGIAIGLRVRLHQGFAYVWAQVLYCIAGILLAGITAQPTAYMGNAYLLPSVAVVVLGGTSLLGGRGFPVATFVAAIFLSQLDQFVLALGVPYAIRTLVQAAALAVGVAIYTVNWSAVRAKFTSKSTATASPQQA